MADSKVPALATPTGGLALADIFYIVDVSDTTDDPTGSSRQDTLTNLQVLMLVPSATDAIALGSATKQFADLFLAEGAVINWDNGDATLTQAGNVLTLAGADFVADNVTVNTALLPDANDGAAIGSTTLQFSDLFLAEGAVINFDNGDVTLTQSGNTLTLAGGTLVLPAGTTTEAPLKLATGGSLLTTAEDGAIEMDADAMYGTVDAGNRGVIPLMHFIRAASDQTLTNATGAQSLFDSPANGRITLETGTYLFEMMGVITAMSALSGNAQFLFGGTGTFADWMWKIEGLDNSTPATISADLDAFFQTNATAASAVTAGLGTALRFAARGSFECTAAGTLIPQIALVTAAAAVVESGSFFYCHRIGATTTTSVGQWD